MSPLVILDKVTSDISDISSFAVIFESTYCFVAIPKFFVGLPNTVTSPVLSPSNQVVKVEPSDPAIIIALVSPAVLPAAFPIITLPDPVSIV